MKIITTASILCLALFVQTASSTAMYVTITKVVAYTDGSLGNCAAKISPIDAIAVQAGFANGLGAGQCSQAFISMDCNGTYTNKADANRLFQISQLAYITGKQAYIEVNPSEKHNGFCTASRIDVLP